MNECSCINVDVDECVTILTDVYRKTRKEHRCYECRRVIRKGDRYRYETFVNDGTIDKHKTCLDCNSIRKEFFCGSFMYTQIIEDLQEHVYDLNGEISSDCLGRLTPGARERVVEMIDRIWEEWDE